MRDVRFRSCAIQLKRPCRGPSGGLFKDSRKDGLASDGVETLQVAAKEALRGPVRRAFQGLVKGWSCKRPRRDVASGCYRGLARALQRGLQRGFASNRAKAGQVAAKDALQGPAQRALQGPLKEALQVAAQDALHGPVRRALQRALKEATRGKFTSLEASSK
jgi:hypothetical protein